MKTKQDNDMTDGIDAIYDKNEPQLLWPIKLNTVYDEKQTGQWWNQSIGLVCAETKI